MLEIRFDDEKLKQVQRVLRDFPKALPKVMSRGLNRTATSARTWLARTISQRLKTQRFTKKTGKISAIKKTIHHFPKATYANWRTELRIVPGKGHWLIGLDPQEVSKGISYQSDVLKGRSIAEKAFIATGKSRGRQVWLRSIYRLGYRKYINWRGRKMEAIYPLREPPHIFNAIMGQDQKLIKEAECYGAARLQKNIHDQVNLILKRKLPA